MQSCFAAVNIFCLVGFGFRPQAACTVATFSFATAPTSSTAVTSSKSSQPFASTGFTFSTLQQPGGASMKFGSTSFSFGDSSNFSFKPPQPAATENKGKHRSYSY